MENPNSHGRAEKTVRRVLDEFFRNQDLPITHPDKQICGLSLEMQITNALRAEGLLNEDE